ncbi:hypothetical protein IW261DRAFT_227729 [Armillaria novae-zelandiae]|uniref:Uncharacterized protein n=1 Tax=Armillaria novae-zelandiae TaxID=153914 RepID=A0AA39P6C2_9AGAR|nr:hypothetical protein IW261DRAFT_227729 [Armillaria novae-zelandiae]
MHRLLPHSFDPDHCHSLNVADEVLACIYIVSLLTKDPADGTFLSVTHGKSLCYASVPARRAFCSSGYTLDIGSVASIVVRIEQIKGFASCSFENRFITCLTRALLVITLCRVERTSMGSNGTSDDQCLSPLDVDGVSAPYQNGFIPLTNRRSESFSFTVVSMMNHMSGSPSLSGDLLTANGRPVRLLYEIVLLNHARSFSPTIRCSSFRHLSCETLDLRRRLT